MPDPCPPQEGLCSAGAAQASRLPAPSSPRSHQQPSSAEQLRALGCSLSSSSGPSPPEHPAAGLWILGVWSHSATGPGWARAANEAVQVGQAAGMTHQRLVADIRDWWQTSEVVADIIRGVWLWESLCSGPCQPSTAQHRASPAAAALSSLTQLSFLSAGMSINERDIVLIGFLALQVMNSIIQMCVWGDKLSNLLS